MPGRENGGSSGNTRPGCHATTGEVCEILFEGLAARGIDRAASIAREITEIMRQRFAGSSLYFPLSLPPRLARDAQIFEAFDGHNHRELATMYGCTIKCIYEVIRRERQRRAGPNAPPPADGRRKPKPPDSW